MEDLAEMYEIRKKLKGIVIDYKECMKMINKEIKETKKRIIKRENNVGKDK